MTSRRAQHQEYTYFRVLRMLQTNLDVTPREIAEQLCVSTSASTTPYFAHRPRLGLGAQLQPVQNKFDYIYVLTLRIFGYFKADGQIALVSRCVRRDDGPRPGQASQHGYGVNVSVE